jgi:hypothetical protein
VSGRGWPGLCADILSVKASPSIAPSVGPMVTMISPPLSVGKAFSHPSPIFFHLVNVWSIRSSRAVDRRSLACASPSGGTVIVNVETGYRSFAPRVSHHLLLLQHRPRSLHAPRYRAGLARRTVRTTPFPKLSLRKRTPARRWVRNLQE